MSNELNDDFSVPENWDLERIIDEEDLCHGQQHKKDLWHMLIKFLEGKSLVCRSGGPWMYVLVLNPDKKLYRTEREDELPLGCGFANSVEEFLYNFPKIMQYVSPRTPFLVMAERKTLQPECQMRNIVTILLKGGSLLHKIDAADELSMADTVVMPAYESPKP